MTLVGFTALSVETRTNLLFDAMFLTDFNKISGALYIVCDGIRSVHLHQANVLVSRSMKDDLGSDLGKDVRESLLFTDVRYNRPGS